MPDRSEAIAIASDHGGFTLKEVLKPELESLGCAVLDLGPASNAPVDYPDFANALAAALGEGRAQRGVLICGSGIGISIAANRHKHIRAALVHDALGARLCRLHNDANVLCLGERLIGVDVAKDCLKVFLTTDFEGGRHQNRVAKLG
ncbi:ribose 5-phosphate isomerase B [Dongia soli]|uniref:Ribose 5-phosphate isomerase B n=1 Tax=Dongia soli TaxID=600628 RepID=A0ABU5EAD1_9PROT|nr:ribose 5-phosphate isomerase B [Dongia soli]MDY0883232.1 ribose 5-phosphate isomerase B [Dongia soli]